MKLFIIEPWLTAERYKERESVIDTWHPSTALAGAETSPGVARQLVTFSCFAKKK